MEERIREILAQTGTKTSKIKSLILLGVARAEIARLLTNGNYGQVQNVYTKMIQEGIINRISRTIAQPTQIPTNTTMTPRNFDKQFGVELECYNVNRDTLRRKLTAAGINCNEANRGASNRAYWKITNDGSIRGINGFELVSPILQGEEGLSELMKVCKVLNDCKAKVNRSCGTHVHINARNFTLEQWKRLYINYARLESVIDGWMANTRRGNTNTYCKGFSRVDNFESRINNASTLNGIATGILNGRYWKVNPQSYSVHNTCEFRQHSGTTNYVKLSAWVRFLSNLVDYSEHHIVNERTLNSLKAFNSNELVDFFKYRTLELAA